MLSYKTYNLAFVILLLACLLTIDIIAQPHIDSLKIIPSNPTNSDTVKLICYTFQTGAPCNLADYIVSINNSIITINTYYPPGPLAVLCNSIDTVVIGVLSTGCYEAQYFMTDTTVPVTYDIDTIYFCVQQSSGLQNNDYSEQRLKIYPNPFSKITTIFIDGELLTSPIEIRMYDIFGRVIKRIETIRNREINITRDNLIYGLYFIKVICEDKIICIRKTIIE